MVKDKLSKALVLLTTRLEQTQRELDYSQKALELAMKAQDRLDENFGRAVSLFKTGNSKRQACEDELQELQRKAAMWLPNFTKYVDGGEFQDGLRFVTEDVALTEEQE